MMKVTPFTRSRFVLPALLAGCLFGGCDASPVDKTSELRTPREDKAVAADAGIAQDSPKRSGADVVSCGGETTQAAIELYFKNLRSELSGAGPDRRFNQFVRERFGIRSEQGKPLWFDLTDFNAITPGKINLEEWKEISTRGPDKLVNAGWRGCFLDDGKVWFEATEETGLKLTWISKDMPWEEREGD